MHFTSNTLALVTAVIISRVELANAANCPGVMRNNVCCVGGNLNLETCEGWPICKGPDTIDLATSTLSCATEIPVTVSNYDDLVSSASSKFLDKAGSITSTVSEATATDGEDATQITVSTTSDTSTEDSKDSESTTSATSTENSEDSGAGNLGLGYTLGAVVLGGVALL